jgi:DNA-binding transcriptional MerR regulator
MALRIGKLASLTGRSVHTIRWYEAQRLIPGVRRDLQGRRVYNEQHVEWLALLERLRRSGMSIKGLREYATMVRKGAASARERQQFLRAHRGLIEQRMAELTQAMEVVDAKIEFYGKWLSTGVQPSLPAVPAISRSSASGRIRRGRPR